MTRIFLAGILLSVLSVNNIQADEPAYSNRLAKEKSPYLLQHASNPVDWYPWGAEAFEKAKAEDKVVFLSVGYSTCHWCHVMEEESFTDPATAQMLNRHFVAVKVDREEHPEVDKVYMDYVVATTGSGGWPMSVFMTPERKPFFGGTYFPKENSYGRAGFKTVLSRIHELWQSDRQSLIQSADSFIEYINKSQQLDVSEELPDTSVFTSAYRELASRFDPEYGGFGNAPKFPSGHTLRLLLRHYYRTGEREALRMTEKTLRHMAYGGIYDHVGGGFHRYSVDAKWFVPHFEKMLYDQAGLMAAYLDAWKLTGNPLYRSVIEGIARYVMRDMQSDEGGYFTAEDADSLKDDGQKSEGAYYLWQANELDEILGGDAAFAARALGIHPSGNIAEDPHREFTGMNHLSLDVRMRVLEEEFGLSEDEIQIKLKKIFTILFDERQKRSRPLLDDKVLTDWNGMMISAMSSSGAALENAEYIESSKKALHFIKERLWNKESGQLFHRYRNEDAALDGRLEDYVYMASASLDLFDVTSQTEYLEWAFELAEAATKRFYDPETKRLFMTQVKSTSGLLPVRAEDFHDGAVPSGISIALSLFERLNHFDRDRYGTVLNALWATYGKELKSHPTSHTQALLALDKKLHKGLEIVLSPAAADSAKEIHASYLADPILVVQKTPEQMKILEELAPFTKGKRIQEEKFSAWVCENYTCDLPIKTEDELRARLNKLIVKK